MNNTNKLLKALNENINLNIDKWTLEHSYYSNMKKWVANIVPSELLKRSLKDSINSLMTLNEDDNFYDTFPEKIQTHII